MNGESFSWGKFFKGLFNPLNLAKSAVFGAHITLILIFVFCLVFTALWLKNKLSRPKPPQTITISGMTGGAVHNSTDEVKKKYGLLNIF